MSLEIAPRKFQPHSGPDPTEEAEHLFTSPRIDLTRADRIRLAAWPAPIAAFVYTLLIRGCILDGWAGWYYAFQRMLAETLIAIELIDRWLRWKEASAGDCDPRS